MDVDEHLQGCAIMPHEYTRINSMIRALLLQCRHRRHKRPTNIIILIQIHSDLKVPHSRAAVLRTRF